MMKVSNRQRQILEVLLNRQGEVTAGQLAQAVQISARTVHRELQELEPDLNSHGLSLVKKSGFGIIVEGDEQSLNRFQSELRQSETETYSPHERKLLMLCLLLDEEEPIKLFSLAREAQAAIPTISRDLEELEPQLMNGGLQLVRKRGYGVEITGSEIAKRSFVVKLAEDYLDHSDFFGAPSGQTDLWPTTRKLLHLVGQDMFMAIEQALFQHSKEWLKRLKESDYTRLLIRLSVAISRIKRGHLIQPSVNGNSSGQLAATSFESLSQVTQSLGMGELPDDEIAYLQLLFDEAEHKARNNSAVIFDEKGLELAEQTAGFIRLMEMETETPYSKDRSLLAGLISHLGPAIRRLREGESIRNPLLAQIKKDYEVLFDAVRRNAEEIWIDIAIPDEEIGYLVMHFGAAVERWKLTPGNVRVLLVCTSGIGSSKLLAVRITKEIPQVQLLGHYSWYEASRMPQDRYDLIVSTVDLPIESERYIKLSPLLTREEAEKLRLHVRELALSLSSSSSAVKVKEQGAWERLQLMKRYTSEMIVILEQFQVYRLAEDHEFPDLQSLLVSLLDMMSLEMDSQINTKLAKQLVDREAQGSVIIPDTKLALLHTRSEWVSKPVISLFNLKNPIYLGQDSICEVRQIFLMLAPVDLNKPALEVLSEISAMLLLPEMVKQLEDGNTETIRAFISRNMEAYMKTKLEWREPS
ncbi:BglG family transcription antiterminator [Cohnella abietis]|uniref:Transcriptional regulator MtlR n=1 Tax=Cohnella abietis TaxID=2507935 RepID=A0A3T1DE54_9BACL|nr:BglG family transcription antiterminator [Cohnella abietis]BBI36373.1 transcriptional regulator MtlR [Cohnella abietis]